MINLKIAKRFLELFNHQTYTLCRLSKKGMISFPCNPSKIDQALEFLDKENKTGSEIYFMVNEGSGELNEKKSACHSTKNVISLSSIFLDLELNTKEDPLPALNDFCDNYFYKPSLIIETSPLRYHVYWLIVPESITKESVTKWKQIQALLHEKLSSDRTMTDISQILRIPGYTNVKKDYPVSFLEENKQDVFSLKSYYSTLATHFPEITKYKAHEPLKPITQDYKVKPGERHEELIRRARAWYSKGLTDDEVKCTVEGFLKLHVTDNKDFQNGKRESELARILSSAKSYHETAIKEENEIKVTKAVEKIDKKKSPFELDPEFYYQAPGLVGEITRHFVDTSDSPIPSHAFAAAASIVGFTKARYVQGIKQLPPTNYFLCLAPSGSGKTTIQHMVKNVMKSLQISHLIEDGIASAQGLIQFLYNVDGLGMIIYDEVRSLFQIAQSKHAASFETMIPVELTKLYTAYKSSYIPPTTKTYKGKKVTIDKPKLSFIGYGQHTLIHEKLFTLQNIQAGLLPRFIILAVKDSKDVTAIEKPLPTYILDKLRNHVTLSALALEDKAKDTHQPIDTTPKQTITLLDNEAQQAWNTFRAKAIQLKNDETQAETGLEAMYSRGAEQALRLSLCLTDTDVVELKEMEFCIQLVGAQMQNFKSLFSTSVNTTDFSNQTDRLFNKLLELIQANDNLPIQKSLLQNRTQAWFKPGEFKNVYQSLIDQEKIVEFRQKSATSSQQKTMVTIGETSVSEYCHP